MDGWKDVSMMMLKREVKSWKRVFFTSLGCVCVKVISTRGENFNELGLA